MGLSLLSPPIAFVVILAALLLGSYGLARFARRVARGGDRGRVGAGFKREPYTGGERLARNQFPPEFAQFFPFAFSFVILHVAVLTIATMPLLDTGTAIAGGIYVAAAAVGFLVLMRR